MMNRLKAAALAAALWMLPAAALAQSSPGWPFGYVPTAAEWNAAFASKTDFTGSSPITSAGGTFTGKVTFANSTTGTAGMNCGVGTAPSSPVDGDLWCTTAGAFARINGSTISLGSSGGTLAVTSGGTGQTTFTASLPILGNGTSALAQGTRSGTTTVFGTVTGPTPNGACVSFDASGNLQNAGVGACGGTGGSGTVSAASSGQLAIYTAATTVAGVTGCNNGYFGTNGAGTVSCITTVNTTLSATITALGTIASGTWNGGVIAGQYGGTNAVNTGRTLTLGGDLTHTAMATETLTLTTIGATNVTFPTSGNLMNQNGTSGGIPYYNTTTTTQSSALLTANKPVIGGGAGASPSVGTVTSTNAATEFVTYAGSAPTSTHCANWDANHNLTDSGATCAGASGGAVLLVTLNCGSGTPASCTDINSSCPAASSMTGCFDNTYLNYQVVLTNLVPTTPANNLGCQIHVYNSGGTYQTSGYKATSITSYIPCYGVGSGGGAGNLAAPGVSGSFTVFNPSASAKNMWISNTFGVNGGSNGFISQTAGGGYWDTNAAIVGFRACFGTTGGTCSGTIASGTIKVYGLP